MSYSDRMAHRLILVLCDVRSAHNVGSLLRTADGLGIKRVIMTGITPYPMLADDSRLPHLAGKLDRRISKTALGAEKSVDWAYESDIRTCLSQLKKEGYLVAALEQAEGSQNLTGYRTSGDTALVVGSEVGGLAPSVLEVCDVILEIPMSGRKESLNVAVAGAIGMYHLGRQA